MNTRLYNILYVIFSVMFCAGALLIIYCIKFNCNSIFYLASYMIMSNFLYLVIMDIYKRKKGVKKNEIKKID